MDFDKPSMAYKFRVYLNTLNRIIIWGIAFYVTWRCYHFDRTIIRDIELTPTLIFHVWFNVIGLQLLMVESIMIFSEHNPFSMLHSTRTKRIIHLILQTIGVSFVLIGTILLYIQRYELDHFSVSWHTIAGYICCILFIIGVINGVMALWAPEMQLCMQPSWTKLFHSVVGATAFVAGVASLYFAYFYPFFEDSPGKDMRVCLIISLFITTPTTLMGFFKATKAKIKDIIA